MLKHAFTFVELLIVLVIIGIVGTVGAQAFTKLRDEARQRTLSARIKQLNIAKQQFITEYGRLEASSTWATPPTIFCETVADNLFNQTITKKNAIILLNVISNAHRPP